MPLGYYDNTLSCYYDPSANQCTTLDTLGNGDYNGLTYSGGDPADGYYSSIPSSTYTNTYFIAGQPTSLNASGNGAWSSFWYIGGVLTTLNSSGTGTWNGVNYVNGEVEVLGTKFTGSADGNWDNIANWTNATGTSANVLPDGTNAVTVVGSVTSNMTSVAATLPGLTVSGSASFGISVTVSSPGVAVFKNSASLANGATITGDVEFRDTSYLDSGAVVDGNVTFKGRAYNKNGVSGTITSAHGGGINGSNILGVA